MLKDILDESNPYAFGKAYFEELLKTVEMKELAPISISPAADPRAPGFSGMQELTTSHASFHYFWDPNQTTKNPNVHIDLYSCAPFSYEDVIQVAHKHFNFSEWTGNFIERQLNVNDRISLQLNGSEDTVFESTVLSTPSGKVVEHAVMG